MILSAKVHLMKIYNENYNLFVIINEAVTRM